MYSFLNLTLKDKVKIYAKMSLVETHHVVTDIITSFSGLPLPVDISIPIFLIVLFDH